MARKKTVLVVVAHADDMEFLAGGTVARFVFEKGYDVYEYILTDNAKGSYRLLPEVLIELSAREAIEAGETLGLKEVRFEGYPDGELNEVHPNVLRGQIMAIIRELKADVVMSWDPFAPGEDHPDHRMVAMATLEAISFASNPLFYPNHRHPPYMVTEAYWFAKHPWNADYFVDISSTIDKKIEALLKHDCQMALTVDALAREAEVIGADVPITRDMPPEQYRPIIEMGVRRFCAETGAAAGMAYAERFRHEKPGMLDKVLGTQFVQPDF
ncbi:MAG TPA: PIG-L family deacetylase [Candidatus Hydrogenedentes bacterium]|nr:PIG-L family deacetylase [Candidatus Hydrogenedentota bacterium]HOV75571.1 PIG-L family deacetylase [Candidatus Hydrogenedentota bacterium]HPC17735.1 PIG-L family deacetylase [Candidatus Hydrogenedentota bacterium]HRT20123.1 PIG-L family deacetylase [Candidatus Hydrogenedentota bacterium]HRT66713.1 PIG-L family deacetylase [Candidatus Hydrogenedentota bacterium]